MTQILKVKIGPTIFSLGYGCTWAKVLDLLARERSSNLLFSLGTCYLEHKEKKGEISQFKGGITGRPHISMFKRLLYIF